MEKYIDANDTVRPEGDFETVRAAIKLACEDGCRTVKIPRYNKRTGGTIWSFMHAIELPHDFTLLLDNCFMEQAKGSYENLIINEHAYDPEWIREPEHCVKNIRIIGEGHVVLSGGEHNHLLEKTVRRYHLPDSMYVQCILQFQNVEGLEVRNIHLKDQRWWAIVHECVRKAVYKNIHFEAIPHVPNLDGFDLRVGCYDFLLENFTGRTGDDVIAFTALSGRNEMARKVKGMSGDIHDIRVRNLKAASHNCNLIRLLNHDGNREYNYDIDTIMDSSDQNSFQPRLGIGIGSPFYFHEHPACPGDTGRISVKNVYTRATSAVRLAHVCADAEFSNIHSFGECRNFFDTVSDGMTLSHIRLDHLYFGTEQPKYPNGETVEREKYTGYFVHLPNVQGDVAISDVEMEPVGTGVSVYGGVQVRLKGVESEDIVNRVICDEKSSVVWE